MRGGLTKLVRNLIKYFLSLGVSMKMVACSVQHLSNIHSVLHESSNVEANVSLKP